MTGRRAILAVLVLLALGLRLGYFLDDPNTYTNAGLVADHGEVARNIVDHGEWFVRDVSGRNRLGPQQNEVRRLIDPSEVQAVPGIEPEFQPFVLQMPGVGVLLAGAWKVTGDKDYGYVQVLQVLLGAGTVLLVYWCSLSLFRRPRAALIAAGIYALFPPLAEEGKIAHLDTFATYFTIAIVALFLKARESERAVPWLLACGVVTGIGIYFRPGVALLPVALGMAMLVAGDRRRALRMAAVPTALTLVLMAPWTIRNYVEFDRFIPTRAGVGQNLWEGLGEIPNDFGAILDDQRTEQQVKRVRPDLRYGTPEYDDFLRGWATDAIADHPGHYARVVARRVAYATLLARNASWAGDVETPATYNDRTGGGTLEYVRKKPLSAALAGFAGLLLEPGMFLLALLVVAVTWRRFRNEHVLLLAVPVATALPYLVLHIEARYMLTAAFVYMILVGLGADLLLDRRRPQTAR